MKRDEPKIISVGFAVPPQSYTQTEVFEALGYPRHFRSIFQGAQIEKRHFWVSFSKGREYTWQRMREEYKIAALELSKTAITGCLDGRDISQIGCITFTSCTGYECPAITYHIAQKIGLREDVLHIPIVGDGGCAGAGPALKQAYDFTKLTGKMSLVVSCEICSTCLFPENPSPDPRGRYQLLRANAIFGDGASAVLVGFDNDMKHPYILDSEVHTDTRYIDALGFEWRDGRLSCVLSSEVPELAPKVIVPCVERLLSRNNLKVSDIMWWVMHPGGSRVLTNCRDAFGLSEEEMSLSREGLRLWGNCSSSSVGIIGKLLMAKAAQLKGYCLVITVGSGMSAHAILLHFGEVNA